MIKQCRHNACNGLSLEIFCNRRASLLYLSWVDMLWIRHALGCLATESQDSRDRHYRTTNQTPVRINAIPTYWIGRSFSPNAASWTKRITRYPSPTIRG